MPEASHPLGVRGHVGAKDLDGDRAIQARVLGTIDHAHPALADLLNKSVLAERFSHRHHITRHARPATSHAGSIIQTVVDGTSSNQTPARRCTKHFAQRGGGHQAKKEAAWRRLSLRGCLRSRVASQATRHEAEGRMSREIDAALGQSLDAIDTIRRRVFAGGTYRESSVALLGAAAWSAASKRPSGP